VKGLALRREHTGIAASERSEGDRNGIAQFLRNIPFLDGRLLDGLFSTGTQRGDGTGPGVAVGVTDTTIAHGLGRKIRGFIVLDTAVNGVTPVRSTTQPADEARHFSLIASSAVTVKLWVW
jgi:hypothetical protein